jgi:hypothetical protein
MRTVRRSRVGQVKLIAHAREVGHCVFNAAQSGAERYNP